jgi:hypothetical protein
MVKVAKHVDAMATTTKKRTTKKCFLDIKGPCVFVQCVVCGDVWGCVGMWSEFDAGEEVDEQRRGIISERPSEKALFPFRSQCTKK